jgi:hypothetical protein
MLTVIIAACLLVPFALIGLAMVLFVLASAYAASRTPCVDIPREHIRDATRGLKASDPDPDHKEAVVQGGRKPAVQCAIRPRARATEAPRPSN